MNFLISISFVEWVTESCITTIAVDSHFDCIVKMSHWGCTLTYVSLNNCEGYKFSYIFISHVCLFKEVSIQLFNQFIFLFSIMIIFSFFSSNSSYVPSPLFALKNLISFLKIGEHILYIICIFIYIYHLFSPYNAIFMYVL